jgi:MYXO-CTERM domain-containing protein
MAQPADPRCDPDARGCYADTEAAWMYRNAAFDDVSIDTGWVPSGAPIQLRFVVSFGGSAEVDLAGDVVTQWPPPLAVSVPGDEGTGRLAINYGLELSVRLRFDVNVAGIRYRWEGDIPVPLIPEDLRAAAEGVFDPFLLPPSERPVVVRDVTDRVEVLRYDALGGIISVPGVGGGLALTVQGDLAASYETLSIEVTDASPIDMEDAFTVVGPDPGLTDYGPAKDLLVHPEGVLGFDADVVLAPVLYLSFAGTRRDFPLVEIPVSVADRTVDVVFDDHATHVPLPDLRLSGTAFDVGEVPVFGEAERVVVVENVGEAPLVIDIARPSAPFAADRETLTLPPDSDASFTVSFAPEEAGPAGAVLTLSTNDPDEGTVVLRLSGEGIAAPAEDAGVPMADAEPMMPDTGPVMPAADGGCGCRTVASSDAPARWRAIAALLFLALSSAWRRRRRCARAPRRSAPPKPRS